MYLYYVGLRNNVTLFVPDKRSRVMENTGVVSPEMTGEKIIVRPVLLIWSSRFEREQEKGLESSLSGNTR